jgi:hypothetical protein
MESPCFYSIQLALSCFFPHGFAIVIFHVRTREYIVPDHHLGRAVVAVRRALLNIALHGEKG